MSERNVAAETGTLTLMAWGNSIKRDIHAALDRYSCPECGGWDGMHDVTVTWEWSGEVDAVLYVNPTGYPGSVFVTCAVCNRAGTIPAGFTVKEANDA